MATIDGKTLTDCFSLVAACGNEVNGLHDMLDIMLIDQLKPGKDFSPCVLTGKAIYDYRMDDSTWVCTDIANSFPLKATGKGNKGVEQHLGYQISMAGDGIAVSGNTEPLLHVFCWRDPCNFRDEFYAGFPHDNTDEGSFEVVDDRLMLWGDREATGWNKREWCYSLRLTTLNSQEDLNTYVIVPAMALLKGGDALTALPDSWLDKELIRYPS